jgi:lysophospholipase L1-like esterase
MQRKAQPAEYRVTIVGDSYTGGSNEGGLGAAGWPAIVKSELNEQHVSIDERVLAEGGAGYVHRGTSGGTFGDKVSAIDRDDDLVVFFASRNDGRDWPLSVAVEAASTWRDAKQRAPDAKILVIGPAWSTGDQPSSLLETRDLMRAQAASQGIEFVDPLGERWFADSPQLIGSDGIHPNDRGHEFMASKLAPLIEQALSM